MSLLNPKLNVFIIKLEKFNSGNDESQPSFRDLFIQKYSLSKETSDKDLMTNFYNDAINQLGTDKFRKDEKNHKVLGLTKADTSESINNSVVLHSLKFIIEGVIDGGEYGVQRDHADIDNKGKKETLPPNQAVLDNYYLCMQTRLDNSFGVLIVQSYTESTITDSIKKYIEDLFSFQRNYKKPTITPYVPSFFIEQFKKGSTINLFSFQASIGLDESQRDDHLYYEMQDFNIKIEIRPTKTIHADDEKKITSLLNKLVKTISGESKKLVGAKNKRVQIKSGSSNKLASFDIDTELNNIKPTIYVNDIDGIKFNDSTGRLDYSSLSKYCLELMSEIESEIKEKVNPLS